jgi:hypothetical protein
VLPIARVYREYAEHLHKVEREAVDEVSPIDPRSAAEIKASLAAARRGCATAAQLVAANLPGYRDKARAELADVVQMLDAAHKMVLHVSGV